jgi:hypothetical protein
MTSVERSFKNIASDSAFFMNISAISPSTIGFTAADLADNESVNAQKLGSVINVTEGTAIQYTSTIIGGGSSAPAGAVAAGSLFRDMGKTLYVQQESSNVQIFKYVQLVNGLQSEGVSTIGASTSFYLPVWQADGNSAAKLVRTGY